MKEFFNSPEIKLAIASILGAVAMGITAYFKRISEKKSLRKQGKLRDGK